MDSRIIHSYAWFPWRLPGDVTVQMRPIQSKTTHRIGPACLTTFLKSTQYSVTGYKVNEVTEVRDSYSNGRAHGESKTTCACQKVLLSSS